jgi:hypothetical protein
MRIDSRVAAKIGVTLQFAALIQCLAEYFRLKCVLGPARTLARVEPFILGGIVAAVGAFVAVLFYFSERYWLTARTPAITVVTLLILRFALL